MGKASRSKRQVSERDKEAVRLSSEIVLHPNMRETFLMTRQNGFAGLLESLDLTKADWEKGFEPAFKNRWFQDIIKQVAEDALPQIWAIKAVDILQYGENKRPPDDAPQVTGINLVKRKLCADLSSPLWSALVIASLARAIGTNAKLSFDSNEWSEASMQWMALDKSLMTGEGKAFAEQLHTLDREYLDNALKGLLATRVPHAIAELSVNTLDTEFFSA